MDVWPGNAYPLGATYDGTGTNFSVFSEVAEKVELCLVSKKGKETRLEMEDWADGILSALEVNLDKFLSAVRRGRERLHERSQETVMSGIGPIDPIAPDDDSYL